MDQAVATQGFEAGEPPALPRPGGRRRGFLSARSECDGLWADVQGSLPDWLDGSLLLNGPALWDLPGGRYAHWFDGLAQLHRLRLHGGDAHYQSRWLRSEDWRRSTRARRPQLGGFDTPVAGGLLSRLAHLASPRRSDNGCVVLSRCDGQWLASTESDRINRIDAGTLATDGEFRWADAEQLPLMAAHPCIDANGRWWNVGLKLGRRCEYVLFSADRNGRRSVRARIPVARPGYLHAFAMSAGHAVIWECAWRLAPLRLLLSGRSYARCFDWLPEQGSRLHAVRLADGAVQSWEAPPLMLFHAVQAFEQGSDLVLDLCLDDISVVDELALDRLRVGSPVGAARPKLQRFVLSPDQAEARAEDLPGRFDLPQVNAAVAARGPVRYVWGASASRPGDFFNRTIKLDHRSGEILSVGVDDGLALEPLFVPRPGASAEDDGVLLVHALTDADPGSRIRVLDAATLAELARIELPHVIPFGFHGAWSAAH